MRFFSRESLFEQKKDKATKYKKKSNVINTYHTIFIYGIAEDHLHLDYFLL